MFSLLLFTYICLAYLLLYCSYALLFRLTAGVACLSFALYLLYCSFTMPLLSKARTPRQVVDCQHFFTPSRTEPVVKHPDFPKSASWQSRHQSQPERTARQALGLPGRWLTVSVSLLFFLSAGEDEPCRSQVVGFSVSLLFFLSAGEDETRWSQVVDFSVSLLLFSLHLIPVSAVMGAVLCFKSVSPSAASVISLSLGCRRAASCFCYGV